MVESSSFIPGSNSRTPDERPVGQTLMGQKGLNHLTALSRCVNSNKPGVKCVYTLLNFSDSLSSKTSQQSSIVV